MLESDAPVTHVLEHVLETTAPVASPERAAEPRAAALELWVRRIAAGDQAALAALYNETSPRVYALALRITGSVADAEEVTLDVYTHVWRSSRGFDPRRGNADTWLVMLARSRAIDRLRSNAARRQREAPDGRWRRAADSVTRFALASRLDDHRRLVRAALAALSADQRAAIELAFFAGLTHRELAATLGCPLGTVKTRIRLGITKLRQLLGEVT